MPRRNRNAGPLNLRTCFVAPLLALTAGRLYEIMAEVLEANRAFIENLNRAQLFAGQRADSTDITPDYTPLTVVIKQEKGQRSDRVTLRDTGAFYESIFTEVFDTAFELKADDPKTADLQAKYGKGIFGLTAESKQKLIDHIRPVFIALVRAELSRV